MSGRDDVSGGRDKKRGNDEGTVMMMGYRNGSRVTEERGDVICVSFPECRQCRRSGEPIHSRAEMSIAIQWIRDKLNRTQCPSPSGRK